ncbi:hypothetical protein LguiA_035987 [Lonicera macranthoides]|jgi:hypothetical protein
MKAPVDRSRLSLLFSECTEKLNALVSRSGVIKLYKQGSGYGSLMGNRLKQQQATKTYEVRSGSL